MIPARGNWREEVGASQTGDAVAPQPRRDSITVIESDASRTLLGVPGLPSPASLRPITLRVARRFIAEHHRHNAPPRGWLFGVQLIVNLPDCAKPQTVGVGIASRPVARALDDGTTLEITRLCLVEGAPKNAASRLYGALCRAGAALGYTRAITYTLASEAATSVRAAGFVLDAELDARDEWTPQEGVNRRQRDLFGDELRPAEAKVRWVRRIG